MTDSFRVYVGTWAASSVLINETYVLEPNCFNVALDLKIDGISQASFQISNYEYSTLISTYRAYLEKPVQIYHYDGNTETLKFEGYISSIIPGDNYLIFNCEDILGELEWNFLDAATQSDFVLDEGLVSTNPTDYTLTVKSLTGDPITWTAHQYLKSDFTQYYVIVSDSTSGDTQTEFQNGSNDYIGFEVKKAYGDTPSQNFVDIESEYGSYDDIKQTVGETAVTVSIEFGGSDYLGIRLYLNGGTYGIANTETLTKIEGRIQGIIRMTNLSSTDFIVALYQSPTATGTYTEISHQTLHHTGSLFATNHAFTIEFEKDLSLATQESYFVNNTGTNTWTGGYLLLSVFTFKYSGLIPSVDLKWYQASYTLSHYSSTFDDINAIISDNGTNTLTAEDKDANAINFYSSGVIINDKWSITKEITEIAKTIGQGRIGYIFPYPFVFNNGNRVYEGYAKRYNGISSRQLFDEITKTFNQIIYVDYADNIASLRTTPRMELYSVSPWDYLTSNGSALANMKSAKPAFINTETPYGVLLFWKDGYEFAIANSDSRNIIKETREDIRTKTEAVAEVTRLADGYPSALTGYRPDIECEWDGYVNLRIGYKQDLTIYGDSTNYTPLIIKKVSYSWEGGKGLITTKATLGGLQQ